MNDSPDAVKPASAPGPEQYYPPPPPPGPPPAQAGPQHAPHAPPPQAQPIPAYDPAHPHYASPPSGPPPDDIYSSSPPNGHHYPQQQHSHQQLDGQASAPAHAHANAQGKQTWSDRFAEWGSMAAAPLNALAKKMGSEAFLPIPMDKECEKAARILKAFCKHGIYEHPDTAGITAAGTPPDAATPAGQHETQKRDDGAKPAAAEAKTRGAAGRHKRNHTLLTIPSRVIARAQGLAIFTNVRAGFHVTGATGSGVLLARLPDGGWSPPSGILVHSLGAGLAVGIGIYDCVVVINTREALAAFTRSSRVSLGSDLAVTAGPWGIGGSLEWGLPSRPKSSANQTGNEAQTPPAADATPAGLRETLTKPVYGYVKSRGFYVGVQLDGTVMHERHDANEEFYGACVSVGQILRGEVPTPGSAATTGGTAGVVMWPAGATGLLEVLRGADSGWSGQSGPGSPGGGGGGGGGGYPAGPPLPSSGPTGCGSSPTGAPAAGYAPGPGAGNPPYASGAAAAPRHGEQGGATVPGATAGMRDMNLGDSGAAVTSQPTSSAADARAAEEAVEPAGNHEVSPTSPPGYHDVEAVAGEEGLPPAYVDQDGTARPGVGDHKKPQGPQQ